MMSADQAWAERYEQADGMGELCAPRGHQVREQLHRTVEIDLLYPCVLNQARKVQWRFAAAEALWICEGSDRLQDLLPYNPRMAQFSDDGVRLRGAYGPRILAQAGYVCEKIRADHDTRQATLTIWSRCPAPSKDIPCTVAMDFKVRNNLLNMSVFMRSSDVWLGLPYDIFSFSCVAYMIVGLLRPDMPHLQPGGLFITAASSHLYDTHWDKPLDPWRPCLPAPKELWSGRQVLLDYLRVLKDTHRGDPQRWWEVAP